MSKTLSYVMFYVGCGGAILFSSTACLDGLSSQYDALKPLHEEISAEFRKLDSINKEISEYGKSDSINKILEKQKLIEPIYKIIFEKYKEVSSISNSINKITKRRLLYSIVSLIFSLIALAGIISLRFVHGEPKTPSNNSLHPTKKLAVFGG